jgi:hypothetical protein
MPVTLTSVAGVVTIDLNANPSDFYRITTTENITSWNTIGDTDGIGFLLRVTRTTFTVSWTGLIDSWTNGVPTPATGTTIYFPVVFDGTSWIGESPNVVTVDPAFVGQAITHTSGALAINMNNGHSVEVTLNGNVTDHTITNFNFEDILTVYYLANGGTRTVDFTPATPVTGMTDPLLATLTTGKKYRSTWIRVFGANYLLDAELVT